MAWWDVLLAWPLVVQGSGFGYFSLQQAEESCLGLLKALCGGALGLRNDICQGLLAFAMIAMMPEFSFDSWFHNHELVHQ